MNLNIIGKRKIFFTISIVAMVLVLLVTIFVGPTLDIEFKGGSIATYSYTGEMDPAAFEKTVEQALGQSATVQQQENSSTGMAPSAQALASRPNRKPSLTAPVRRYSIPRL